MLQSTWRNVLSCMWHPWVFADDARGWQCPFVLCLHSQGCLWRGVRASGSYQERTGKSGLFGTWHLTHGWSRISSWDRPHPEVRHEGREPLLDKAGGSTFLPWSGAEKGLKWSGARNFGVPLEWDRYIGELLGSQHGGIPIHSHLVPPHPTPSYCIPSLITGSSRIRSREI